MSLNTSKLEKTLTICTTNSNKHDWQENLPKRAIKDIESLLPHLCDEETLDDSRKEAFLQTFVFRFIGSIFCCFDSKNFIMSQKVKIGFKVKFKEYTYRRKYIKPDMAISPNREHIEAMMEIKGGNADDEKDLLKSIEVCSDSALTIRDKDDSKSVPIEIAFLIGNKKKLTLYSVVLEQDQWKKPKIFEVCTASLSDEDGMIEVVLDLIAILIRKYHQNEDIQTIGIKDNLE